MIGSSGFRENSNGPVRQALALSKGTVAKRASWLTVVFNAEAPRFGEALRSGAVLPVPEAREALFLRAAVE
jgi:hypothetical protein